jgi:hypothetical protein
MKRARIILTAITVFAIVGGALAFKTKGSGTIYCNDSNNHCTVQKDFIPYTGTLGTTNPCGTNHVFGTSSSTTASCPTQGNDVKVTTTIP